MARIALLIPAETYRASDFTRAAGRLGVEVVVVTDEAQVLAHLMGGRAVSVDLADPTATADAVIVPDVHPVSPPDADRSTAFIVSELTHSPWSSKYVHAAPVGSVSIGATQISQRIPALGGNRSGATSGIIDELQVHDQFLSGSAFHFSWRDVVNFRSSVPDVCVTTNVDELPFCVSVAL